MKLTRRDFTSGLLGATASHLLNPFNLARAEVTELQRVRKAINYAEINLENRVISELFPFLSIPNISPRKDFITNVEINERNKAMLDSVRYCKKMLLARGFKELRANQYKNKNNQEIIENVFVTGKLGNDPSKPTMLIYYHADVQDVKREAWVIGNKQYDPFIPTFLTRTTHIKGEKGLGKAILARGSSDDKGQGWTHLFAIESYQKTNTELPTNFVVVIDHGEENGSPYGNEFVKENREYLKSDIAMIADSLSSEDGIPSLDYGLRGILKAKITLDFGNDVHSGEGNIIGSAMQEMIHLLSGIGVDSNLKINIPGIYEDIIPVSELERKLMEAKKSSFTSEALRKTKGLAYVRNNSDMSNLEVICSLPSFEVHNIEGGKPGTKIPSPITADVTIRLAPGQDPEKVYQKLEDEIYRKIYSKGIPKTFKDKNGNERQTVNVKNEEGSPAVKIDLAHPYAKAIEFSLLEGFECSYVDKLCAGGTEPIASVLQDILRIPVFIFGYSSPGDNYHGALESFLLKEGVFYGTKSNIIIYDKLAKEIINGGN